jgi:signal transduction histidine kinase
MASSDVLLIGSYDQRLVALSVVIATLASYAALDLAGRVTAARGRLRLAWLGGGAAAMAVGIWSMHYVGMLAFRLPIPVSYDWLTALVSFGPALFSSALSLFLVGREELRPPRVWVGGLFMGGGIAGLHYTAMESMRMEAMCRYSPWLVALSVAFAVTGSAASLWLMFLWRGEAPVRRLRRGESALLMGAAIAVMHYTGMASASFSRTALPPDWSRSVSVSALGTAGIGGVGLTVLAIAMLTSLVDRLQRAREQLRALIGRLESLLERERIRISHDLHDELGQQLTALRMRLRSLETGIGGIDPGNTSGLVDRAVEASALADEAIATVRRIAFELRPAAIDRLGLVPALQEEIRHFRDRTGIACEVHLPDSLPDVRPEVANALYRICQEAMTNVSRHAAASRVVVRLDVDADRIRLRVEDDGKGFDQAYVAGPLALGLLGMTERARALGGEVLFRRGAGPGTAAGTTVTVTLPFAPTRRTAMRPQEPRRG